MLEIPTASRTGYVLVGWFEDDTMIELPYTVTKNLTLIAKWEVEKSAYVYNKHKSFNKGIPYMFTKENESLNAENGFIYVFKDGKFIRGTIKKEE